MALKDITPKPTAETPEGFVVISTELFASFMAKWGYRIKDWGKPYPARQFSPDTAHFYAPVVMEPEID